MELDELKKNLNQILETKKTYSENGKGFSFGEENNNPFANFLYQSNLQVKHEFNSHSIPEKIDYKIEEVKEMSSAEKNDKIFEDKYDITNDFEKNLIFDKKPPLSKNSSLKNLKLLDDSLKNKQEFERIAKIMKGNFDKSKKFSDFSSDSDC